MTAAEFKAGLKGEALAYGENLLSQVASHGDYTVTKQAEVDVAKKDKDDAVAEKDALAIQVEELTASLAANGDAVSGLTVSLATANTTITELQAQLKTVVVRVEQLQVYDGQWQADQKQRRHDELVKTKQDAEAAKEAADKALAEMGV